MKNTISIERLQIFFVIPFEITNKDKNLFKKQLPDTCKNFSRVIIINKKLFEFLQLCFIRGTLCALLFIFY